MVHPVPAGVQMRVIDSQLEGYSTTYIHTYIHHTYPLITLKGTRAPAPASSSGGAVACSNFGPEDLRVDYYINSLNACLQLIPAIVPDIFSRLTLLS